MKTIEYLRKLPENSGQIIELETANGVVQFRFMWFHDENTIDMIPCDNINIMQLQKKFWHKIKLVF